jgi:hypothetical protein
LLAHVRLLSKEKERKKGEAGREAQIPFAPIVHSKILQKTSCNETRIWYFPRSVSPEKLNGQHGCGPITDSQQGQE